MLRPMPINYYKIYIDIIENASTEEFIQFAKTYNIFQTSQSTLYDRLCDKIKQRLDKEGLSLEVVRPD